MSLAAHPLIRHWITRDGDRLVVHTGKVDIGQRISTALVQIAHDELTLPVERIVLAPVRTGAAPDEGITSGSNSVEQSGHALRCAGATLRGLLIAVAVERGGGAPDDWTLDDGVLTRPGSNAPLSILDLFDDIDPDAPVDPDVAFAAPRSTATPMRGIDAMVRGTYTFVQDLGAPGLLHARIVRPPHALARLDHIPEEEAAKLREKGLHLIVDGSFVAVAGPREWPVIKAADRLANSSVWDRPEFPNIDVFEHLIPENATRLPVIKGQPMQDPVPDPLDNPDHVARFEKPYLMHAALGPSAAMAQWDGTTLTIQCHSQGIYPLRTSIAQSLDLDEENVVITHVPGSGCYGHNGADDAAFEAALIARALPDTPVLLKWTRAEEHAWEPFAPAMAVDIAAKHDASGRITQWSAEAFSDTHRGRPRPGENRVGPSRLLANRLRDGGVSAQPGTPNMNHEGGMHRNLDPIYDFADKRMVKNLVTGLPHRTSALRCLGATANVFAIESVMDDMARAAQMDPIAYRRQYMTAPRDLAVLDGLADKVAALPDLPDGAGRGIAYGQYKNAMTRVGVCVDVTVTELAEVRLDRVIMVADAGRVVDLDGLSAQLEGGFVQAASWALYEQVTWDRDGITSCDWDSYPVIRFDNMPEFDITVLDHSEEKSVGAGEASPGPTVAAIANAIRSATGLRLHRLPFRPDAIMQAAMV